MRKPFARRAPDSGISLNKLALEPPAPKPQPITLAQAREAVGITKDVLDIAATAKRLFR